MTRPARLTPLADRLALGISAFSSPFLVLPFFILVLVRAKTLPSEHLLLHTLICLVGLVGFPLLYIIGGMRRGTITDVHVALRHQRRGPILAASAGAAVSALLLREVGAPVELQLGAVAMVVIGGLFGLISLRWKISIHPATLSASTVICGMLVSPAWFGVLALLPAVVWARVHRGRHTWMQGVVATALAALVTAAMVRLYVWYQQP